MSLINNLIYLNNEVSIKGLVSEPKNIYIYNKFVKTDKTVIVICNDMLDASRMVNNLRNYTNNVLLFPVDNYISSLALAKNPEYEISRMETLKILSHNRKNIIVTTINGFLKKIIKLEELTEKTIEINVGQTHVFEELLKKLYINGYRNEELVEKTGSFSKRGYIIDVFPISSDYPYRIEFFGDEIESIRIFDIETQKTIENVNKITIPPYNLNIDINYTTIGNFLPDSLIISSDYEEFKNNYQEIKSELEEYKEFREICSEEVLSDIENKIDIKIFNTDIIDCYDYKTSSLINFTNIEDYIKKEKNKTIIICLSNRFQINNFLDKIDNAIFTNENEIFENKINLIIKKLNNSFKIGNYIIITENTIFNKKDEMQLFKTNFRYSKRIKDLDKLKAGEYVVHPINGIGQYLGIKTLKQMGIEKDYLVINYLNDDKLYVPVTNIDYIKKYSSNEGIRPKINRLGSNEWNKTKTRVQKKIEDITQELLSLYAIRENSSGFAFETDSDMQIKFENEFKYTETVDQFKAILDIKEDMISPMPMDRLLCGDVGFGKTEVAFRAIMKAILSKKQVALLCPTTILSQQHYNSALERFSSFAVNIKLINRYTTASERNKIINDILNGSIDLLIGTHSLLNDEIKFKDLGLLVVDEEQRFGVKQKEKIKQLRNNIDILTLSATPIPRTLQMSIAGIRSLSMIETPPKDRFPIQTYVLEENSKVIKDAINKEVSRGGQVFLMYNKVEDMKNILSDINALLPHLKICYAHGRMNSDQLEDVMLKFINKEYDVLICTTIIETGIDIPNVNTIIILEADHFGLSQLYQIRGRVGRSNKIAHCYLMYKKGKSLSEIATKRLNVIKEFTELGSGFAIAMRDLSIRGAGDLLGSEQAGFIDSVGIELFLSMLKEEIEKQKGNIIDKPHISNDKPLIDVHTSIDNSYIDSENLKLEIHRKINEIDCIEKINELKVELEDRFGKVNEKLEIYMYQEWFEKLAYKYDITNFKQSKNSIEITLEENILVNLDGISLFDKINKLSKMFRFKMKNKNLIIILDTIKLEKHFIYYLIDLIKIINDLRKDK